MDPNDITTAMLADRYLNSAKRPIGTPEFEKDENGDYVIRQLEHFCRVKIGGILCGSTNRFKDAGHAVRGHVKKYHANCTFAATKKGKQTNSSKFEDMKAFAEVMRTIDKAQKEAADQNTKTLAALENAGPSNSNFSDLSGLVRNSKSKPKSKSAVTSKDFDMVEEANAENTKTNNAIALRNGKGDVAENGDNDDDSDAGAGAVRSPRKYSRKVPAKARKGPVAAPTKEPDKIQQNSVEWARFKNKDGNLSLYNMRRFVGVVAKKCEGCEENGYKSCPPIHEDNWETCGCLVLERGFIQAEPEEDGGLLEGLEDEEYIEQDQENEEENEEET